MLSEQTLRLKIMTPPRYRKGYEQAVLGSRYQPRPDHQSPSPGCYAGIAMAFKMKIVLTMLLTMYDREQDAFQMLEFQRDTASSDKLQR